MKDMEINQEIFEKLVKLFMDNNKLFLKEDSKYEKGVKEILELEKYNIEELRELRNNFVKKGK